LKLWTSIGIHSLQWSTHFSSMCIGPFSDIPDRIVWWFASPHCYSWITALTAHVRVLDTHINHMVSLPINWKTVIFCLDLLVYAV
jgi:hypothetical protein